MPPCCSLYFPPSLNFLDLLFAPLERGTCVRPTYDDPKNLAAMLFQRVVRVVRATNESLHVQTDLVFGNNSGALLPQAPIPSFTVTINTVLSHHGIQYIVRTA